VGIAGQTRRTSADKWLPASGIVFVALTIIAVAGVGGNTPDDSASAAKVASYYAAHHRREEIAPFILAAGVPFLAIFGTYLAAAFPARQGGRSVWQRLLLAGTAISGAVWVLAAFIHFALADGSEQHLTATVLQGLNVLDSDTWVAFNSGLGVLMLGAGGTLLSAAATAGFRRLGWAAAVLGVVLFIPFADFIALLLSGIWIIVTSVVLIRSTPAVPEIA
jgi:hypothetical protein